MNPWSRMKAPSRTLPSRTLMCRNNFPPQTNPEPEMGAAAAEAAEYDTPPPHLRQIPSPAPSETTTDNGGSVLLSPLGIAQMVEMITQATRKTALKRDAYPRQ